MARRKRERMSEGKKNIIAQLIEEYDIKTAKDIEDALKDLLGGTIQEMLESEMDEHLGYREYERSENPDYRNGKKTKKIRGNFGEAEIEVSQDHDGAFEPLVVKKLKQLKRVIEKLEKDHPNAMKSWHTNWDIISPIFKFSAQVRKVIYTTNAIDSVNKQPPSRGAFSQAIQHF